MSTRLVYLIVMLTGLQLISSEKESDAIYAKFFHKTHRRSINDSIEEANKRRSLTETIKEIQEDSASTDARSGSEYESVPEEDDISTEHTYTRTEKHDPESGSADRSDSYDAEQRSAEEEEDEFQLPEFDPSGPPLEGTRRMLSAIERLVGSVKDSKNEDDQKIELDGRREQVLEQSQEPSAPSLTRSGFTLYNPYTTPAPIAMPYNQNFNFNPYNYLNQYQPEATQPQLPSFQKYVHPQANSYPLYQTTQKPLDIYSKLMQASEHPYQSPFGYNGNWDNGLNYFGNQPNLQLNNYNPYRFLRSKRSVSNPIR